MPLPSERGRPLTIDVGAGDALLALVDPPVTTYLKGLVVVVHGLGGSSGGVGVRRLGLALQAEGFAVMRLNMRGAGPGRSLARGTYAAQCNRDLLPALQWAREMARQPGRLLGGVDHPPLPLFGAGISLGGTMLLNACLELPSLVDALVCISSPLDLAACAAQIERARNRIYQRWLLNGLCRQTIADPFGLSEVERASLSAADRPSTIREFDALITAPRWGYPSVADYYRSCSPLAALQSGAPVPPSLLIQSLDDPWVPAEGAMALASRSSSAVRVEMTSGGGHGGFHGIRDDPQACWSDRLTAKWLFWVCSQH